MFFDGIAGRSVIVGGCFDIDVVLLQVSQQIGCTLRVRHRQRHWLVSGRTATLNRYGQHRPAQKWSEQGSEYQSRDQSPAVTKVLPELLPEYAQGGPRRE